MSISPNIFSRIKNIPVREIIRALEKDGFKYRRMKGSSRIYRHPDGRRTVIHYHHSNDTLPSGTLKSILEGTRWTDDDIERLGLI